MGEANLQPEQQEEEQQEHVEDAQAMEQVEQLPLPPQQQQVEGQAELVPDAAAAATSDSFLGEPQPASSAKDAPRVEYVDLSDDDDEEMPAAQQQQQLLAVPAAGFSVEQLAAAAARQPTYTSEEAVDAELAAGRTVLGCSKCRYSTGGCFSCRQNVVAALVSTVALRGDVAVLQCVQTDRALGMPPPPVDSHLCLATLPPSVITNHPTPLSHYSNTLAGARGQQLAPGAAGQVWAVPSMA